MTVLLSGIVIVFTHAVEVITGFGCTVMALPFLAYLIGLRESIVVLSVLGFIISLYITVTNLRHIDLKEFVKIVILTGIGLPAGMYLFANFSSNTPSVLW